MADRNIRSTENNVVATTRVITDLDYINFLVAAQCDVSCVKAAECYSEKGIVVAHDKINRFLTRESLTPETLWKEVKRYGFVRVVRSVNKDGKDRFCPSNFLTMNLQDRKNLQAICWSIENYHRALKELCCVEDCKIRKEAGQRNHINCSLRAFIRLEAANQINNITISTAKWEIVKSAIGDYLALPKYEL